jgi:hypothetical protein
MEGTVGAKVRVGQVGEWELTGNHDLAFPLIATADGALDRVNVLHRGALGLLEWAGGAGEAGSRLLAPELREGGAVLPLGELEWERVDRWIPRFRAELGSLTLEGTVCAPGGGDLYIPGAVYLLEVENRGRAEREIEVALAGVWQRSLRTVGSSRTLSAPNRVARGHGAAGFALELGGEPSLAALALRVGGAGGSYEAGVGGAPPAALGEGGECAAPNGEPIALRLSRRVRVAPGRRVSVPFYIAAAVERDGALERAAALERMGAAEMIRLGRLALAQMARRTRDPVLGALLNRNLLFNFFYAVGRAVDDEWLYPLTSRSPLAPRCSTFRERDALLWSLPALQLADSPLARELLLRAFEQYSHRPGAEVHYLDGSVLSGAFLLDQFTAYGVALERYLRETKDESILEEPIIQEVLREQDDLLVDRLHPRAFLAATELLPSGEMPAHPYVTYDNVMLWAFCRALERVWPEGTEGAPPNFTGADEEVGAAIWRHLTAEVEGLRVLACSANLTGEAAVYDDPEGSLLLLPALGFCPPDDPVWKNTIDFLHSHAYPFWYGTRPYPGLGSRLHPDEASLAALLAALLGPRKGEALKVLRTLTLEGDVASERYDLKTGRSAGGRHHAALAGFLAWALGAALGG